MLSTFETFVFTENNQHIQQLINMRCAIKTCCSTPAIKHILISYLLFAFGRLKDRIAKMRRINCVCPCPKT